MRYVKKLIIRLKIGIPNVSSAESIKLCSGNENLAKFTVSEFWLATRPSTRYKTFLYRSI